MGQEDLIWAEDLPTLKDRIRTVLDRCRELNVTISRKNSKLAILLSLQVTVSDLGIRPDDHKYTAVADFPETNQDHSSVSLSN